MLQMITMGLPHRSLRQHSQDRGHAAGGVQDVPLVPLLDDGLLLLPSIAMELFDAGTL